MIWANPRDVILYARTSYYYNNMSIIYLSSNIILILSIVLVFEFYLYISFLDITSSCFPSSIPCLKFTLHNIAAKRDNQP